MARDLTSSRSTAPSVASSKRDRREDDRHQRDRRDDDRHSRRQSRSPDPDRRYRDRDPYRDSYRREYRSPDRRDDRSYATRRDRSRDRLRSPDRLSGRSRRRRSRDRDFRDRRENSRDRFKRRRDDSAESHYRPKKDDDRDERPRKAPRGRSPNQSEQKTPPKPSEEDKKAERLAKLEAWKRKQAADRERKNKEEEIKGGTRGVLEAMDKKASQPSASPVDGPGSDPAKSPAPYTGKFDPKAIAKKVSGAPSASNALGGDVPVPENVKASKTLDVKGFKMLADNTKRPISDSNFKPKSNLGSVGQVSKTHDDHSKGHDKPGFDFGEEEAVHMKLERLPDPLPEDQSKDVGNADGIAEDQDDDDDEIALADNEESDVAAARAALEKRGERSNAEHGEEANSGSEDVGKTSKQNHTNYDQDTVMTGGNEPQATRLLQADADEDPLDAFMADLDESRDTTARSGQKSIAKGRFKQQEPQAMFGDDEAEPEEAGANSGDILEMASKTRKKKDIPTVNHSKMDYEPFRKDFYNEPFELASMTEEDVADLRIELDGIKVRGNDIPKPVQKWSQCGLGVQSLDVINKLGFDKLTSIQAQAIPSIMSGRDVIGIAKTGSGKTIAFLLPMFRHIKDQRPLGTMDGPIGLILTPTRELATQIHKECKPWLKALNLRAVCAYGGAPIKDQIADLKKGAEIIVCTPGRMIDLLTANAGRLTNLKRVTYTVLDEADRMFDMGFEPQVMKILANIRPQRQTVLFSATFPRNMEALARKTLSKPVEIVVGGRSVVAPEIKQLVEVRPEDSKFIRLLQLLGEMHEDEDARSLIFVDRQESAEELMNAILRRGYPCFTIHGGKDQYDRDSVISDFKAGVFPILVATSVAARGLDVKQLKMVVNFDCPNHLEDYVHRAGRTGRAGNEGLAVTFITEQQERYSASVAKALKQSGQDVPDHLQKLVDAFSEKVKSGKEKTFSTGFGGKGLEEVDRRHDAAKARERKAFKTGDEPEEEKEEKEEKEEEMPVKPAASAPARLPGVPEGIDLDGQITVHKTEAPPPSENKDRMKGVSEAVAAINARLRKTGDIRGNAPIDNKGPDAGAFHATLEINDFPQKARWAVTNRTNVAKILEATGTSITTKGNFYSSGATPGANDAPKLYILVEGDTEVVVTNAMRELMRLLKDGTAAAMDSEARAPASGRYSVV